MTPENLRFHAAGHLAAGVALAQAGNIDGARTVYRIVRAVLDMPNIDNPPAFRESLDRAIEDPAGLIPEITELEAMFCSPTNTALENAGLRMGKG